jgi:hypothetical protein
MRKRMRGKSGIECYYCGKTGHTIIYCKTCASDLLKGKIKGSTNVAIVGDSFDPDRDDDPTK